MHGSVHAAAGRRLPQETMDAIERAEEEPSSFEIILIWFHHILRWGLARGFRESLKIRSILSPARPFAAQQREREGRGLRPFCMVHVASCMRCSACCMLHVVCCMLYAARRMLHGACCLFRVVCCVRYASCAARRSARRSCSGLLLPASLVGPSRVRMVLVYALGAQASRAMQMWQGEPSPGADAEGGAVIRNVSGN